ncbi:MAG: amidophosphoribosyltransferase [Planctomycetota bacterium]|jgi:amidophosphoribosyltransferase
MCGFISILGPDGSDVIQDVLTGLLAIQHRGQDAAGVVTYGDKFQAKKGLGLVRDVFEQRHLERLRGHIGVGHVRYPTVGGNEDVDVQPFWLDFPVGIAMAHNGNVTNFHELKRDYFPQKTPQSRLASNCDLEAVLYVFASVLIQKQADRLKVDDIRDAVTEVFRTVKGAYSVVGMVADAGMYAFRDPYGIKPIILGKKETEEGTYYACASESVVLDVAGYEVIRDLKAGEMLWIDKDRTIHVVQVGQTPHRACIFEYIYFARPDSVIDGASVYETRLRLGDALAEKWRATGLKVDAIIPVPESARTAAQQMAENLEIPYREGFVKNRYVGRTFIMPNDKERRSSIRHKLNPIRVEFEGKDVLIVDDSIVRGNTMTQIVRIARQMGARKVYIASYSPALLYPCPYGIDMATKREFLARDRTIEQICEELGCDHLVYQGLDEMVAAVRAVAGDDRTFCTACFTGDYPTGDITERMLADIEADRLAASSS